MRQIVLKSLKWVISLLAALTAQKALDSLFCSVDRCPQAPWRCFFSLGLNPLELDPRGSAILLYIVALLSALVLFLMVFRYFISSIYWIYEAFAFKGDPEPDFWTSLQGVTRIHVFDIIMVIALLVPQFYLAYMGATSLRWVGAFLFWLALLPIVDLLVFALGGLLLFVREGIRLLGCSMTVWMMKHVMGRELSATATANASNANRNVQRRAGRLIRTYLRGPMFILWDLLDLLAVASFFLIRFHWGESVAGLAACNPLPSVVKFAPLIALGGLALVSLGMIVFNWKNGNIRGWVLFIRHV